MKHVIKAIWRFVYFRASDIKYYYRCVKRFCKHRIPRVYIKKHHPQIQPLERGNLCLMNNYLGTVIAVLPFVFILRGGK